MCAAPIELTHRTHGRRRDERLAAPPLNDELCERDDAIFTPSQECGEVTLRIARTNRQSLPFARAQIRAEVRCYAQTSFQAVVRGHLTLRRLNHSWILYQFACGVSA